MIKILFILLGKLPLTINRKLGYVVGCLLVFNRSLQQIITTNINLCFPRLNKESKKRLIKKAIIQSGIFFIENFFIWNANNISNICTITGKKLLNNNRPTILMVPHFACFETIARAISPHRSITCLYKKSSNKAFEELITKSRVKDGVALASTTHRGIYHMTKKLKNGDLVAILPDHYPTGGMRVINFFNNPVRTTTLLSKIALKYNAEVLLTYALRTNNGYNIFLEKTDIKDKNLTTSMSKMNKTVEGLIAKHPEQYLWAYKRFKGMYN